MSFDPMDYIRAGLSVMPADAKEKRPALATWKQYTITPAHERVVARWKSDAWCLACGAVSGGLEMIDFDCQAEAYSEWRRLVETEWPECVHTVVIESSQSGGLHVIYRAPNHGANQVLAAKVVEVAGPGEHEHAGKKWKAIEREGRWYIRPRLIETRGQGGQFLCAPTPGYAVKCGSLLAVPTITEQQRDVMIEAAQVLNQEALIAHGRGRPRSESSQIVIGEYNAATTREDVAALLTRHGWVCATGEYWRRPGKERGWSARLRPDGSLMVWTTSDVIPAGSQSPFAVLAYLDHSGDFGAAVKAISAANKPSAAEANAMVAGLLVAGEPKAVTLARGPAQAPNIIGRRKLHSVSCADIQPEPLRWLWPGRVEIGGLTMIQGDAGLGKSFISIAMATAISRGDVWPDSAMRAVDVLADGAVDPGYHASPGRVLMLSAEDPATTTIVPRLIAAGADLDRVRVMESTTIIERGKEVRRVFTLEHVEMLRAECELLGDVRLVVLDPIQSFMAKTDEKANTEVRLLLEPLARMSHDLKNAVCFVTHMTKKEGAMRHRALGSVAFFALSRVAHAVAEVDGERMMLRIKANNSKPIDPLSYQILEKKVIFPGHQGLHPVGHLEWRVSEASRQAIDDVISGAQAAGQPRKKPAKQGSEQGMTCVEWLDQRATACGGQVSCATTYMEAAKLGWSDRTVRDAAQKLGLIKRIGPEKEAVFSRGNS